MSSVASCANALRCGTVERRKAGKARCRTGSRNMGSRVCVSGITRWITARLAAFADFGEHCELLVANCRIAADPKSDNQRLRAAWRLGQLADWLGQRQTDRLRVHDVRHAGSPTWAAKWAAGELEVAAPQARRQVRPRYPAARPDRRRNPSACDSGQPLSTTSRPCRERRPLLSQHQPPTECRLAIPWPPYASLPT